MRRAGAVLLFLVACTQVQDLGFDGQRIGDGGGGRDAGLGEAAAPGDGAIDGDASPPTPGLPGAALAAGGGATCTLAGSVVKCWGSNGGGGLASGTSIVDVRGDAPGEMGAAIPPALLGNTGKPVAIYAGLTGLCARFADNRLKCWGNNGSGQLGLGDAQDRGTDVAGLGDFLPYVDLGTGRFATHVAIGRDRMCAALDDGRLRCWGVSHGNFETRTLDDFRGDAPGEMGDALPPVELGTGRFAVASAIGTNFQCALFRDGAVKCWGQGIYGALGRSVGNGAPAEGMGDALTPLDLGTGARAAAITAGAEHACALLASGRVKCWGHNDRGQLGLGDVRNRAVEAGEMGDALPFVPLGAGRTATSVVARDDRTCAVLDDATVKCWGANTGGVLGLGNQNAYGTLPGNSGDFLPAVDVGAPVVALALGGLYTCARLVDGGTKCWGAAPFLGLGLGSGSLGDAPGEMGSALPRVDVAP